MSILFFGGEVDAFIASGGGVAEDAAGLFSTSFARCSLVCDGLSGDPDIYYAESASWAAQTGDFYIHFEHGSEGYSAASAQLFLTLVDGTDVEIFRIRQNPASVDTTDLQMQYLNSGAAWANAGTTYTIGQARTNYDLFVNCTTGVMTLYVAGSQVKTATGLSLGHLTGPVKARFFSEIGDMDWSQVCAANESTIGFKVMTRYASGNGAHTAWTGDYTDIDETVYTDADFITAASTGLKESFTQTGPSIDADYVVRAVGVAFRGKTSGGVSGVKGLLRIGSTDYTSSTVTLSGGYTANVVIWEDDPSTGVDFANAAISSIQFGVESA